jgi:hypothetical protein
VTYQRPKPAEAAFHIAEIHEAMFGMGGDPDAQYVEINMIAAGQNLVSQSRLSAWNANGTFLGEILLVPANVPGSGVNRRWIMGTSEFAAMTGLTPDFTFTAVSLPATGMICWGAPSVSIPPNPPTWDMTNSANYIDCLPYGGYNQANIRFGPASASRLNDGDVSLTRTQHTDHANTDFALMCPSPQNNANTMAMGPDTDGDTQRDCVDTDNDNDGRLDTFERNGGTNRYDPDSDVDTISDGPNAVMTVLAGPDNCPLVANTPQADADGDGMGTACDPNDALTDTDGDGCTDGKEAYRLTPLNPTDPKDWPDIDFVVMLSRWNQNCL